MPLETNPMPIHSFTNEDSGETLDIYVPASAPTAEHQTQTRDGKVYKRVYAVPLAATNMATRMGSASQEDFKRLTTDKKNMKVGDAWEISAEMAAKRKERDGVDFVREQEYKRHEAEYGEKHPEVVRAEKVAKANAGLKDWGIKINL